MYDYEGQRGSFALNAGMLDNLKFSQLAAKEEGDYREEKMPKM